MNDETTRRNIDEQPDRKRPPLDEYLGYRGEPRDDEPEPTITRDNLPAFALFFIVVVLLLYWFFWLRG